MLNSKILIVTRHKGLVDWLTDVGITGKVTARTTRAEVRGKHVYGTLPIYLAAEAMTYTTISIPRPPGEERPDKMSAREMVLAGAYMQTFKIAAIIDVPEWMES